MCCGVVPKSDYGSTEIPFSGMCTPFGAHHPAVRPGPDIGSGTASYFGGGLDSPTSNPFAFVGTSLVGPPSQGIQPNPMSPLSPKPNIPPITDSSGIDSGAVASGQWPTSETQRPPPPQVSYSPHGPLSHRHSIDSLATSSNHLGELDEDPFSSHPLLPPRSNSSQGQNRDTQTNTHDPFSGSASAPVTGLVFTAPSELDRNVQVLDPSHTLFQSLTSSSSGSVIERPPMNPHLPPPSSTMTNAEISSGQSGYLPVAHSYPHLPTNATNADGDVCNTLQSSVPPYLTNAVGYPTTPPQSLSVESTSYFPVLPESHAVPPLPEAVTNSQQKENAVEISGADKDFLTLHRNKMQVHGFGLLEGDHSSCSSLNQSMSSLLDGQEDIAQQSPVQILPPAPESHPEPPANPHKGSQASLQYPPPSPSQEQAAADHVTSVESVETEVEEATKEEGTGPDVVYSALESSVTQPHVSQFPLSPQLMQHASQPSVPDAVSSSHLVLHSDPLNVPTYSIPQGAFRTNPASSIPSKLPVNVSFSSGNPPLVSDGMQQEETGTSLNSLPLPAAQPTTQRPPQVTSTPLAPTQEQTNADFLISSQSAISTSEHQPPRSSFPGVSSSSAGGGDVIVHSSVHSVQHLQQQQNSQNITTSQVMPVPPDTVEGHTQHLSSQGGPFINRSVEGLSTRVPPQSVDSLSLTQKTTSVQFAHSISNPPLLPPPAPQIQELQPGVLSNAHLMSQSQPGVPSNAHPLSQPHSNLSNAHPPPSEAGILSNAHLSQYTPHSSALGVQPPPATTTPIVASTHSFMQEGAQFHTQSQDITSSSSRGSAVVQEQPPHSQQVSAATLVTAVSTTTSVSPLFTQPSHPQSVPLHQAPATNTLPSTPDSVFSQSTEPRLVAATVMSGVPTNAGAPYQLVLSSGATSVHSEVPPTETQTSVLAQLMSRGVATLSQPGVSAPLSSVQQVPSSQMQPGVPLRVEPGLPTQQLQPVTGIVSAPGTQQQHLYANTNAGGRLPTTSQPIATTLATNPVTGPSTSAEAKTVESPAVQQRLPVLSMQQLPSNTLVSTTMHSLASSVPLSGPTQSTVTAPVAVRDQNPAPSSIPHPHRHTGEQLQATSTQVPPPSSSPHPHHHMAEPPPHPSLEYGGRNVGEDGRPWRHTTEMIHHPRERERYDHYYIEDPYRYERGVHYAYEDPYYNYYRERPSSRLPYVDRYGYHLEQYEHDPYAYDRLYRRRLREWDPYSGQYYYVDDPYVYADPRTYEQYSRDVVSGYDQVYGHPPPPREQQALPHKEQADPQRYTQEPSVQTAETTTAYPDQSSIYGTHDVFEEGGTFVNSPNVRGGQIAQVHRQQPPYVEGTHLEYSEYSHYNQEPPLQLQWGSSEEPHPVEPQEPPVILRETPELFAHPHVRASFAPGGTLVVVLPHNLRAFQRAEVELSRLTESISNTELTNFIGKVSEFPGPLMPGETPKSVAVSYASDQAKKCHTRQQAEEGEEGDAETAKELHDEALLWDFLVLLCQQNGVVVTSDISELLTREKMTIPTQTHMGSGDQEDSLESIRQLLIAGRKRDALELACSRCLWGHALMLASKMDEQNRTYVINRFTASLITTDPLSTFYTLMLGRTPSAVKPDGLRRAGNWRPHLAMILANRSSKLDNASIVTLGDSLLESGRLFAAHFCYHLADVQFGAYGNITSKYLLLGVQNSLLTMGRFPQPEFLRKMEVFEYAMSLGKHEFVLPHFQVFKYLLALQLTQAGMVAKAFKYCEQIAVFIGRSPGRFPPTLLHVVDELSTQLHHLNHPHGVVETELPSWLLQLQQTVSDVLAGNYVSSARSTPSPTFSSVSQAYGGRQHVFGRGGQYLKVPGGGYKGSSVETSTATSSKEGSVVGGVPAPVTATAALAAEQDSYQPSPLLQQQQADGYTQPQLQTTDALYSENTQAPVTEEVLPVISNSTAAVANSGVPLYAPIQSQGPFSDGYPPATSAGAEQHITAVADSTAPGGGYGEYGTATTALPNEQQWPPSQDQQLHATSGGQQQPFVPYHEMQGYENQQGVQAVGEQAQQYGYDQPEQQAVDRTQQHMYEQPTQPPTQFPSPSEPAYGGAGYWDQQYPPQNTASGYYDRSGIWTLNGGVAPPTSGQSDDGREEREKEEEERRQKAKESKKDTKGK